MHIFHLSSVSSFPVINLPEPFIIILCPKVVNWFSQSMELSNFPKCTTLTFCRTLSVVLAGPEIARSLGKNMEIKTEVVPQRKHALSSIVGTTAATRDTLVDCAACRKPIRERYLLKALDQFWHEDCLKCACCDCRLGEVGSTLFTKANLILCKRDYLRLFGTTGLCSACNKTIPAFEMVMRARGNVYHLECFACQQCFHRFCVGDRFYLFENKVLCELDYEERVLIASLPYPTYNSLDQIQRQTDSLIPLSPAVDDASSGYGSPSSLISDGH
ncbi:rhombotin-1 [Caerostris extrusa]|uniref:Rhombotin-1 n=1 Tax=Caerostris extrusa TaxID=172846 RepID=A0AAV4TAP0_CAEEX|nr:rhombotin-1 [Caerostris extrusa]